MHITITNECPQGIDPFINSLTMFVIKYIDDDLCQ
jgi:hypothetical protein